MARYIDAELLKKNIRVNLMPNVDVEGTVTVENAERYFLNLIDKASSADVVEVVRCKECSVPHNKWTGCPNLNGIIPPPDFYCAKGERRKDNEL